MKKIIIAMTVFFTVSAACGQGIYGLSVTKADSTQYALSGYQGQPLVFVVLPATQTASDTAFLARVDSVALAHAGQAKFVAVPSYEDGYAADSLNTLANWYAAALDSSILLSKPLYTHRASGAQQDSVFAWLTYSAQNGHFDYEVTGAGTMFFVDGQGNLYGLFGPEAKWSNKAINKVLP
jgi:hypothetical protein